MPPRPIAGDERDDSGLDRERVEGNRRHAVVAAQKRGTLVVAHKAERGERALQCPCAGLLLVTDSVLKLLGCQAFRSEQQLSRRAAMRSAADVSG